MHLADQQLTKKLEEQKKTILLICRFFYHDLFLKTHFNQTNN